MIQLLPGDILFGFCGGAFGRDSNRTKRVEACGADWVVARDVDGGTYPRYASDMNIHEDLARYCERFGASLEDGYVLEAKL